MKKAWPLLLLLAAVAGGLWFVLKPETNAPTVVAEGDVKPREEGPGPSLVNAPKRPKREPIPDAPVEADPAASMDDSPAGPAIHGVVLDDETGAPVEGAFAYAEATAKPCPRLPPATLFDTPLSFWARTVGSNMQRAHPVIGHEPGDGTPARVAGMRGVDLTSADGTFSINRVDRADLFVRKAGYLMACVCEVGPDAAVTVRLKKGSTIEGIVIRENGQPIEGAVVRANPAPGTPMLPGHVEATTTNAEGKFALTGLAPGLLLVSADHPKFVPTTLEPMEPGPKNVKIVLVPAFIVTFKIATDDGKKPDSPSLAWLTTGVPARTGLQILADDATEVAQDAPIPTTMTSEAVRIPCDRPDVTFTVKSVGYAPWVSDTERLPPEGGEKAYDVRLERDLSLGSLKITIEDRDGKPLSFVQEKAQAIPWRRDGKPIPAGVVQKAGDAMEMPALPAGPYGVLVRSPNHSPAMLSVDVPPGRDAEVKAVLGPPARLRVKFVAPEVLTVRFHLLQGKALAYPYPETEPGKVGTAQDTDPDAFDPSVLHASTDGLLLTGLAAGRYTIEVTSPELVANPATVDLVESETREIEVSVAKR